MNFAPVRSVLKHNSDYICASCLLKIKYTTCWQRALRHASTTRVILPTISPAAAAILYADNDQADQRALLEGLRKQDNKPKRAAAKQSKAKTKSVLTKLDNVKVEPAAQEPSVLPSETSRAQSTAPYKLGVSKTAKRRRSKANKLAALSVPEQVFDHEIGQAPKMGDPDLELQKNSQETDDMTPRRASSSAKPLPIKYRPKAPVVRRTLSSKNLPSLAAIATSIRRRAIRVLRLEEAKEKREHMAQVLNSLRLLCVADYDIILRLLLMSSNLYAQQHRSTILPILL